MFLFKYKRSIHDFVGFDGCLLDPETKSKGKTKLSFFQDFRCPFAQASIQLALANQISTTISSHNSCKPKLPILSHFWPNWTNSSLAKTLLSLLCPNHTTSWWAKTLLEFNALFCHSLAQLKHNFGQAKTPGENSPFCQALAQPEHNSSWFEITLELNASPYHTLAQANQTIVGLKWKRSYKFASSMAINGIPTQPNLVQRFTEAYGHQQTKKKNHHFNH